jgi:hypothetical protein
MKIKTHHKKMKEMAAAYFPIKEINKKDADEEVERRLLLLSFLEYSGILGLIFSCHSLGNFRVSKWAWA